MINKKYLFISIFILMIVLSIGAVSAQDADDAIASSDDNVVLEDSEPNVSGTVSGGVDVVTENPGKTGGELNYNIPSDAKTIKSADVYVNVYSGSAQPTYGANANITIATANGDTNKNESLWINEGSTDGTVYTVNDHTTKCYSDYMIHYDITSLLTGLNGTGLKIKVNTSEIEGYQFDGRIKLIALVLAYDDGDTDSISYFINSNQLWSKTNVTVTFDTESMTNVENASLTNIVLSSGDGTYRINDQLIGDATNHSTGNGFYYQYNKWDDVSSFIKSGQNTTLNVAYAGTSAYGSIKNVLSVLTIGQFLTDVSVKTEYTTVPSAYAGTNNTLTVTVNTNKAGKYTVRLLANGTEVDKIETDLIAGSNTIFVTDDTIRPVDESTVKGAANNNVNYTVELIYNNSVVNNNSIIVPVLYNGNLGKDLAYPAGGMEAFLNITVTGDIAIDVKDVSTYLGSSARNRTDVWTINLDNKSTIVKSFIYVPYNWFNPSLGVDEDLNMFNATFNGVKITPVKIYRDQGNLGNYGAYGYGVLVYDVTDLTNKNGENSFNLTKKVDTPAVYPSVLIYMYNTTDSAAIKNIYISNGADLLAGSSNNVAKRPVHADSTIVVTPADSAELYVFAAGAQAGEGSIDFNGNVSVNVWNGTSSTTNLYVWDITGLVKNSNDISFVATGSTILALQQIIVVTKNVKEEPKNTTPVTPVVPAVVKKNTKITAKKATFKANKKVKKYSITLKAGKTPVKNVQVTIKIGKKTYKAKTNAKGKATFKIKKLTKKGTYKAKISFKGNKNYNAASKTVKIKIK